MDEVTIDLPRTPEEMTNELLNAAGCPEVDAPAFYGQLKHSWSAPSSAVSQAVVPDYGQTGNENYVQAYIAYADASPDEVAHLAFEVLADVSLQQAADRAGHGEPARLNDFAYVSIVQTAASEVVKRIWTTAVVENALAHKLGTPAAPATFADAVRRERDSIDVTLQDGREFQVKSEAGSRDGELPHIWTPNFEDYFGKREITARVE